MRINIIAVTYNYVLVINAWIGIRLLDDNSVASLNGLGDIHADVGHSILSEGAKHRHELSPNCICCDDGSQRCDAKERSLSMQVVKICMERHQSWHGESASPLSAKYFR